MGLWGKVRQVPGERRTLLAGLHIRAVVLPQS